MIEDDMREALRQTGYPVFSPGQYEGKCRAPYIVIMRAGLEASPRTKIQGYQMMDVIEYVPIRDYGKLNEVHEKVMRALTNVSGCKRPASVSGDAIESEYQAHSRVITYKIPVTLDASLAAGRQRLGTAAN